MQLFDAARWARFGQAQPISIGAETIANRARTPILAACCRSARREGLQGVIAGSSGVRPDDRVSQPVHRTSGTSAAFRGATSQSVHNPAAATCIAAARIATNGGWRLWLNTRARRCNESSAMASAPRNRKCASLAIEVEDACCELSRCDAIGHVHLSINAIAVARDVRSSVDEPNWELLGTTPQ